MSTTSTQPFANSAVDGNYPGYRSTAVAGAFQFSTYQAQRYMPALDGLRGVAVLLVITCHLHERIWNFLSGFVGVTIFFVLSGYLITRLALQEETKTGTFNLLAFYIRRTFRIFPLYYLVLCLYIFLILYLQLWPTKVQPFRYSLPYYLAYFQEIPFWIPRGLSGNELPFYQSWSLGIEEKFYIIWPLLMACVARARVNLRLAIVVTCAVLCVVQGIATQGRPTYHLEDYGFILFGVSLALFLSRSGSYKLFVDALRVLTPLAVVTALVTQFYLIPYIHVPGLTTLYALAMTLLIGWLVSSSSAAARVLSNPGLVLVGKLSYAIYLFHILCLNVAERFAKPGLGPVVGVLAYLLTFLLSFGVAYVSHRLVERPMIELGRRLSNHFRPASVAA